MSKEEVAIECLKMAQPYAQDTDTLLAVAARLFAFTTIPEATLAPAEEKKAA